MTTTDTTKICSNCGSERMVGLQSYFKKVCSVCNTEVPWVTSEGQKPLLTGKLDDDKRKTKGR